MKDASTKHRSQIANQDSYSNFEYHSTHLLFFEIHSIKKKKKKDVTNCNNKPKLKIIPS